MMHPDLREKRRQV